MIKILVEVLLAVVFGIGAGLTVFGFSLLHSIFFSDNDTDSLVLMVLSFIFISFGVSFIFFVIV